MAQEGALDLDRPQTVGGNLDNLIGAAAEPDVTVFVHGSGVGGEVDVLTGDAPPVVLAVALRLAPERGGQSREGPRDDENPLLTGRQRLALGRADLALDAGQGDA